MSLSKIINENERWLKTAVCVSHHLKNALLQILFNRQKDPKYKGLPENEKKNFIKNCSGLNHSSRNY